MRFQHADQSYLKAIFEMKTTKGAKSLLAWLRQTKEGNENMEEGIHNQAEGSAPMQQNLSSTLAMTSMILGIVSIPTSCVGGFLLGIAAIIVGVIALLKIKKGQAKGKGMAIGGICAGVASTLLLALILIVSIFSGMALPGLSYMNEKAKEASCKSNLKMIGLALKQYALDYGDAFPDGQGPAGFEQLRACGYLTDPKIFVCPSSTAKVAAPGQALTEANVSYSYLGSGKTEANSPDEVLASDDPDNHKDHGCVLFIDGRVESFDGPKWFEKAGLKKN